MIDKGCIIQIIGDLMQNPSFLGQVDRYNLSLADFPDVFTRHIFNAIIGLYDDGAQSIKTVDIENVLSINAVAYRIFNERKGVDYLEDALALSDVGNFEYYYNRLKKINLLNDLSKNGIDISEYYCEDISNPNATKINTKFDLLDIKDIVDGIKLKFTKLSSKYMKGDVTESSNAFEGILDLLDNLSEGSEVGEPIQGEIFNKIVSGAAFNKLYIRSAASGTGKTRQSVGDACYLAFPYRYNDVIGKWENKGNFQKVLFIATEQSKEEIQRMIISYLTGINESKFKYNQLTDREQKILQQALWVLEKYKDNFIITRMPNPTIELVKTIVRENCILYGCQYVFYDYIFIGPSLINEFKGVALRNDEVLLMFATALKDLAVELGVFIMTSTQLNAKGDDNQNIRNESALAGGRATINKADVGAIIARPTQEELVTIEESNLPSNMVPNIVTDIYKIRSGEWNQVRIWSYVDLGTLRKEDLFVTDSRFQPIQNFGENWEGFIDTAHLEEINESLGYLND